MNLTNFAENKIVDALRRGQPLGAPATLHYALLTSTRGPRANTTAYALNDTISVVANDGKIHLYKCTTAGTSAAAQGSLYAGTYDENVTDGTAVFAEQGPELDDGTALVQANYVDYARVAVTASLANFSGTQGAGTTVASTGTSGQTSNNAAITFPAPGVGSTANYVWGRAIYDAASGGNAWEWAPLAAAKTVNAGDAAPSIPAGSDSLTIG